MPDALQDGAFAPRSGPTPLPRDTLRPKAAAKGENDRTLAAMLGAMVLLGLAGWAAIAVLVVRALTN